MVLCTRTHKKIHRREINSKSSFRLELSLGTFPHGALLCALKNIAGAAFLESAPLLSLGFSLKLLAQNSASLHMTTRAHSFFKWPLNG